MRNFTFFLVCLFATANLYSYGQTVQGEPHELMSPKQLLTVNKKSTKSVTDNFTFEDVKFWAGEGENEAIMIIDFHFDDDDGKTGMVWGYRWPEGETATGLDMITTIAKADPRFLVLVQETNIGYTIDGIGFGPLRKYFEMNYNLAGASTDSRISFKFDYPNIQMKQTHCPEHPEQEITVAIEDGLETGVIDHPFNYTNYGYACYDYDYWFCSNGNVEWRSGWYTGYWSYLVKDDINDDFGYSGVGAILRILQDGSVDSWGYQDFSNPSYAGVEPREPYTVIEPMVLIDNVLDSDAKTIEIGSSFTLSYSLHPTSVSAQEISWTSDNEEVATVDQNGVVTSKKEGAAIITASVEGGNILPFSYTINVEPKTSVGINEESENFITASVQKGMLKIANGEGYTFQIYDLNGQLIKSFAINGNDYECDLSGLAGVSILKGTNGNHSVVQKIIF